jgi:16S rRNA (guanine527-N7)-methyltransferase
MMLHDEEQARAFCAELTDAAGYARLERLATLVVEENARQNLIAKASEGHLWLRHLADSAQLLRAVPQGSEALSQTAARAWLDLGTGAGFPGLVIAAMRPEREVVLVYSCK